MSERPDPPVIHRAVPDGASGGPISEGQVVDWAGLKLTGASPGEIATSDDLEEVGHRFDVILESLWRPRETALVMELSTDHDEDRGGASLDASILVGLVRDAGAPREDQEVASLWRLVGGELTAEPSPYEVAARDPAELLARTSAHCHLLVPGSASVSSAGTTCSALVHFAGAGSTWRTLAAALVDWPTSTRVRTSLLSWEPDETHLAKVQEQLDLALTIIEDHEVSSGLRFQAQRIAQASRQLLDGLAGPVYIAEVAICGDAPLDQALLRRVASEIVGDESRDRLASYRRLATTDRTFGLSLTLPPAYRLDQPPAGWRDAGTVGLPARALSAKPRVVDLFPARVARSAFQWPIPWRGPVPSIAATRFKALAIHDGGGAEGVQIGTDASGQAARIDPAARGRHMHVLGVPGSGKTTLLAELVKHDLEVGAGFVAIDPHGDLAGRVRDADEGIEGLVEFGVADSDGPKICLLPAADGPESVAEVERAVGRLVEAVTSHLPPEYSGPRFRSIAKAALTVLAYAAPGEPLSRTSELLYEESYLHKVLTKYSGPGWASGALRNHFRQRESADVGGWVASKFEDLFTSELSAHLVGRIGEGIEVRSLVEDNVQAVVSLDRGALSALEAGLLGHVVLAGCIDAAFDRGVGVGELFSLYVDEIHSFPARNLAKGLSEGRKFGLGLVLAHQNLSQLEDSTRAALVGHCGVDFLFRLSPVDAQFYASLFSVPAASLRDQPDLHAFVRQAVRGRSSPLFSLWLAAPVGGKAW